jgi:hypothetical protein
MLKLALRQCCVIVGAYPCVQLHAYPCACILHRNVVSIHGLEVVFLRLRPALVSGVAAFLQAFFAAVTKAAGSCTLTLDFSSKKALHALFARATVMPNFATSGGILVFSTG